MIRLLRLSRKRRLQDTKMQIKSYKICQNRRTEFNHLLPVTKSNRFQFKVNDVRSEGQRPIGVCLTVALRFDKSSQMLLQQVAMGSNFRTRVRINCLKLRFKSLIADCEEALTVQQTIKPIHLSSQVGLQQNSISRAPGILVTLESLEHRTRPRNLVNTGMAQSYKW